MLFRLIRVACVLVFSCSPVVADVVDVQPADPFNTSLGLDGWFVSSKTYTISNTCFDHVYWRASCAADQVACWPQGGWIAPGASCQINLSPASFMSAAAPGIYEDQVTLDFQPRVLGDANGDDYVNVGDLQRLVLAWDAAAGSEMYDIPCDFNGDGRVNVGDLQLLVEYWGQHYGSVVL